MDRLIKYACDELMELEKKVEKGQQLTSAEVQYMDLLAHAKKNLLKGEEMMEEEGYSNRGDYSNRGYSNRYDDGMNYNTRYSRAGRRNARRDSMGRYSRRGYSMADDEMISELREMMNEAKDDRTRQEFQSFISRMESMM